MKKHLEDRGIYITFPQLIVRILFDLGGFLLTLLPAALTLYLTDVWIGSGTLIPLSWMLGIVVCVFVIHFYQFLFCQLQCTDERGPDGQQLPPASGPEDSFQQHPCL